MYCMRDTATFFAALADVNRLRLLHLMQNGEICVCYLQGVLQTNQPKVSRHLAYLRKSGLVAARRDGVWMHYQLSRSLNPAAQRLVAAAVDALQQLPAATRDRQQFERAFGQMYVLDSPAGGARCAPRIHEPPS